MLELILIPAILGVGLAVDYAASYFEEHDDAPEAVEVTMAPDAIVHDGSDLDEDITGNALDNVIRGGGGDDEIEGHAGDDWLEGGEGEDRLTGGTGDDIAHGGAGDDRIYMGDGDDEVTPIAGSDAGDDFIRGGAGQDLIIDGAGSNEIYGDIHRDAIFTVDGMKGDGSIDQTGERGTTDTLHAGYGNDLLVGDDGDVMTGGVGDDHFVVATALQTPGAPAVLTDFDTRDDMLSLVFMDGAPADPTVTFSYDATTNIMLASVDGQAVAQLSGLNAADMPFIRTYVTTLPDLLAEAQAA